MGRTRRMGRRPPLACSDIQYDTLERFHNLKKHKDEPLYSVYDRACTALEERTDIKESLDRAYEGNRKIQKRLTEKSTDVFGFIEILPKEVLSNMLSEKNLGRLSEDTILEIRKHLQQEQSIDTKQ